MLKQIEHKIFSSFKEWFEHCILNDLQAYTNVSTNLYPLEDGRLNLSSFSAPFYQWVFDNSVTGANIPTAASLSVPYVDYMNGRTLGGAPTGAVNYAIKDFNIYTTTKSDAKLILDSRYNTKPDPKSNPPTGGMLPYQVLAPCIFLKPENIDSEPFTFGGGIKESLFFTAIIIGTKEFDNYAVGAYFGKKKDCIFPYFDEEPLNYYGDYKSTPYNYKQKVTENNHTSRYVYIDKVYYSPVEIDSLQKENGSLFYGRISFECSFYTQGNRSII